MSNFLKSLFGAKKAAKVTKSRMQTRRLELIGLEERIVPAATITNVSGILTISLAAGDTITNLNAAYPTSATLVINTVGNANLTSSLPTGVVVTSSSGSLNDIITVTASTFTGTILGLSVVGGSGTESVTVGGAINLLTNAPTATNSLSIGTNLETLNVNAAITTLGATANISGASLAATAVTIGAAGDIVTTAGNVSITGVISTAGNVTTTSGNILYTGATTLTGATSLATTGGSITTGAVSGAFGLTTSSVAGNVILGALTGLGAVSITTTTGTLTQTGAVSATSLTTASTSGTVSVGALTTTGAVSITTTGATIGLTGAVSAASVTTVGAGAVTLGGSVTSTTGATTFGGAVTGTTSVNVVAGTTASFAGTVNTTGAISVVGAGLVTLTGAVGATGLNTGVTVTSTADNVVVSSTVTSGSSAATGAVAISAATAGKTISLANAVTAGLNSNILLTGDVLSNSPTAVVLSANGGVGSGNITITGKLDAAVAGYDLTILAGTGIVTLTGNIGSGAIAFGELNASGTGIFLASGTVVANNINIGQITSFGTSITFAKAVTANVLSTGDLGINVIAAGAGTITFSGAVTVALGATATATVATSVGQVDISSATGAISVVGAITGLDQISIVSTSGAITLSGAITTSGTNTAAGDDGDITIGSGTSGNVLLSGATISTTGTGDIELDNDGTGTLTITGNVSTAATSATNGNIIIGADNSGAATGAGTVVTINGTVTTTGTTAGSIVIGVNGGTVAVNKAVTAGATGDVIFITTAATDAITIASGATITAGDDVADIGAGILNLGANITAGGTAGILLDNGTTNLTAAVSLKTTGVGSDIFLASVNGNQNLTLEAIDKIALGSVGQTTTLNTLTVTNSTGVQGDLSGTPAAIGAFSAAKVVLTDTTGTIAFGGTTVITTSLTTAAKAYNVSFAGTSSLAGAPVFLNTGNVSFAGTTVLASGATITGGTATAVTLGGTIVSSGAFNIGASTTGSTTITTGTNLSLNSATAASNFAGKVVLASGSTLNLLGVGTLTLSGDSSAAGGVEGNISVLNGTLNVTNKIAAASVSTATNGTISGAGGTIGVLNVNTGTVAPGGTLKTAAVTLNAATNYSAAVLTATTASNLESAAAINLGGAVLSLSSVAAGLAVGNTFTIINNTATSTAITGTFANQVEGSSISAKDTAGNTVSFTVSYKGGTGTNDVTLKVASVTTAVPATPTPTAPAQPMVAGQPALLKFTAVGADAGGGPLVTITFQNGTFVSFFAYASTFTGGVRVALGDVDGNGSVDVITGAGPGGGPQANVYNVNTATGAVSLQKSFFAFNAPSFTGGIYVAAGDTNADGFDDVIIGAGATGGSRVQVYAGSATGVVTSSTLNDFFAYSPAFTGGVVVAAGQRDAVAGEEIITAPASGGGYNIKSFNANGTGNSPTVVDNFFAFNNTTSVGGLSLAVGILNSGSIADLIVGTSNGGYGVIIDSTTSGITGTPFAGFTGAIRAGVAEDANGQDFAVALAGPTGAPRISVFSVGQTSLAQTDSLFVMNTGFTGGLFGTPTL